MDIKDWTYRKKNKMLIGVSILFAVFIYHFVISITVDLYRTNRLFSEQVKQSINAPDKKKKLEKKLEQFNNSLTMYFTDSLKNREYILGVVSDYCQKNNLLLKEFPESSLTKEKDFEIETNIVVAEGGYLNLLKLVYELEQNIKIARPASVNFEKKMDNKRKKEVLTVTIYLQNLKMKKDEKNK